MRTSQLEDGNSPQYDQRGSPRGGDNFKQSSVTPKDRKTDDYNNVQMDMSEVIKKILLII